MTKIQNNPIINESNSNEIEGPEGNWLKLFRSLLAWEWFQDPNTLQVFIYFLLKANHAPKKWQGIEIKRGQFITSISTISKETGQSVQKIRTIINRLKSTHEITCQTTNRFTLVTILKYEDFQSKTRPNQQANQQANQQSDNKRITTNKNDKNIKEEKEDRLRAERIKDFYNRNKFQKFHECLILTDERINKINRLSNLGISEENIYAAIEKASKIEFLQDLNSISLDWITSEEKFMRIIEGHYDKRDQPGKNQINKTKYNGTPQPETITRHFQE